MTDSLVRPGKRERLVRSAAELLHRNGVETTTLAQIAEDADVPPGNVYYYFKTRDDLVAAVIDYREEEMRGLLAVLDQRRTPKARLKGLAESWTADSDRITANGCPMGALSYELNNRHDELAGRAAALLRTILEWTERQFRELGVRDPAGAAVTFQARIQGAVLLANSFGDAPLLEQEVRRLERCLDDLG
jgi:TetR/AcrR family transcriptional repressor of nem operon